MSEKENLHKGHRQRMLKKYLENGIGCFEEHEILEILLFTAYSRCNTNEISHRLIEKFGSVSEVFEARYNELLEVKDVGETAAALICFLGDFNRALSSLRPETIRLDTTQKITDYCQSLFTNIFKEATFILMLDDRYNLISKFEASFGNPSSSSLNIKDIVAKILVYNCSKVILTHNHPAGNPFASSSDIITTRLLAETLNKLDIKLEDHIIISQSSGYSMRSSELLKDIWG